MPEYTYLLDTRLTAAQQHALAQVRDAARDAGMVVFLAGGAVRDLTTGSSVRDLDFAVQGNALELQQALEARGAKLWGRHEPSRSLYLWFPGSVRVEVSSTRTETFPKPGKPVYAWSGIVDDLYRRDFTVNAMALSLNEGSYGLLLDPLNGVADTEARQLRLVSNYGFLEDPSRLLRAVRLSHRMGWALEERTQARYENAKEADNFADISDFHRGYELEEIAIEEDALATLKAYEAEGWMQKLFAQWSSSDADTGALDSLHKVRIQLLMQGIAPDLSAAHLELLTAKMKPEAKKALKHLMVRRGLLADWEGLDAAAKDFARLLTSKEWSVPSATWKLFHTHAAEPVLWLAYTGKGAAEAKFKQMFTVWPEVAKKVPVAMMTELRITPELPAYEELLHQLFLQQIDGKLETDEQMRAFLETYSPPAPPPPINLKRSRAKKAAGKGKRKGADRDPDADPDADDDGSHVDLDLEDHDDDSDHPSGRRGGGDDDDHDADDESHDSDDEQDEDGEPAPPARLKAAAPSKSVARPKPAQATKVAPEPKTAPEPKAAPEQKVPAKAASSRPEPSKAHAKAVAKEFNLDGVDLGAVLERIQSAVSVPRPGSKAKSKPEAASPEASKHAAKAVAKSKPPAKAPAKTAAAGKKAAAPAPAPAKKATGQPLATAGKPAAAPMKAAAKAPAKAAPPAKSSGAKAAAPAKKAPAAAKKAASPAPAKKQSPASKKTAPAKKGSNR